MLAVQGYYDGVAFHALENLKLKKNQQVIITILDNIIEPKKKDNEERLEKIEALGGSLAKYAIKDGRSIDEIMELESKAWEQAVVEKYGQGNA
ncbi:MAG: hypothetical protein IKN12_10095 [Selenomonadaceae bacterium]|nr:hypothetical protein [Selenomonadaceae bacterium]MBR3723092.1 hypothetical protein [Selenomonadaceae bacterium]